MWSIIILVFLEPSCLVVRKLVQLTMKSNKKVIFKPLDTKYIQMWVTCSTFVPSFNYKAVIMYTYIKYIALINLIYKR